VNSFLEELLAMPHDTIAVFLGDLSRMVLEKAARGTKKARGVDGIKFGFVLNLWERLELSPTWGPKMKLTKELWARAIFS
jgi:hypothetical protein